MFLAASGMKGRKVCMHYTHYKSKMADGRHLERIEKLLYLGRGSSDFDEIWLGDAVRPS